MAKLLTFLLDLVESEEVLESVNMSGETPTYEPDFIGTETLPSDNEVLFEVVSSIFDNNNWELLWSKTYKYVAFLDPILVGEGWYELPYNSGHRLAGLLNTKGIGYRPPFRIIKIGI